MYSSPCCRADRPSNLTSIRVMDDIYANVEQLKPVYPKPSANRTEPRQWYTAVIVCLGLLSVFLLFGLIILGLHYLHSVDGSAAEFCADKTNLTERLQDSEDKLSSMTEERDRLTANLKAKMEELDRLKKKTCPSGWTLFGDTCYLVSSKSGSWDEGREDCRGRGADLVVIDSPEEQAFLSTFTSQHSWIGLTDRDEEGTWKWVDGTPLTLTFWAETQPDNGGGMLSEEDCAHVRTDHFWNDLSCTTQMKGVCEL